jgi:hypothetical protein
MNGPKGTGTLTMAPLSSIFEEGHRRSSVAVVREVRVLVLSVYLHYGYG